jgi:hypothetical protein
MAKKTETKLIKAISDIRTRNNVQWMKLLSLAVEASPMKAKTILAAINENDRKISKLFGQLAER